LRSSGQCCPESPSGRSAVVLRHIALVADFTAQRESIQYVIEHSD